MRNTLNKVFTLIPDSSRNTIANVYIESINRRPNPRGHHRLDLTLGLLQEDAARAEANGIVFNKNGKATPTNPKKTYLNSGTTNGKNGSLLGRIPRVVLQQEDDHWPEGFDDFIIQCQNLFMMRESDPPRTLLTEREQEWLQPVIPSREPHAHVFTEDLFAQESLQEYCTINHGNLRPLGFDLIDPHHNPDLETY
ncbi:hypothetical protein NLI96_g7688 [Meripilus lineatus]|uniref:Uncharacterized protein n=1 Tax=Meripilus lineatus TaxID=2056292 RepID=A0AAD5UYR3_9APHY|nr:hypothetical protein NLI96_g7688 [Physisporinus lineatus]